MMKILKTIPVVMALLVSSPLAAETLTVSTWGGAWRDALDHIVGKRFTAETGANIDYQTGSSVTRLNKEKLTQGPDGPDIVYTTGQVGWLYRASGMSEDLNADKVPNLKTMPAETMLSPSHVGIWSYAFSICYRESLLPDGITFESWQDLWSPKLNNMVALHEIDPSHIVAVSSKLEGVDVSEWEKAQDRLRALKPNIKAFYSSDSMSQEQLSSGETPVSLALASNCHMLAKSNPDVKVAAPKEGAVGSTDSVTVMKASDQKELAYKYMNILLDPEVQSALAEALRVSPANPAAQLPEALRGLPGIYEGPKQFYAEAIIVDNKLRSEKLGEWREWFAENMK